MNLSLKAMALVATLLTSLSAQASTTALAERYLRATQIPEMLQAQVEGYADQYAKGQDAAYHKRVHDDLERVMGWEALKKQYLSLVQATYTEQEISAFLQFVNTPAGRSMKAKNTAFANKLATIAAQRAQEVAADQRAADGQEAREDQDVVPADLVLTRVEKFQSADQVYFTGEITNNGKKAARGVTIEANLFRGDRFVDQYSSYVTGSIPSGGSRLFKISCGCKGTPPAEHDSYKLQVLNGY